MCVEAPFTATSGGLQGPEPHGSNYLQASLFAGVPRMEPLQTREPTLLPVVLLMNGTGVY